MKRGGEMKRRGSVVMGWGRGRGRGECPGEEGNSRGEAMSVREGGEGKGGGVGVLCNPAAFGSVLGHVSGRVV